MKKGVLLLLVVFLISFSGCATANNQKDLEIQSLRNQITALEAKQEVKDEQPVKAQQPEETQSLVKVNREQTPAPTKAERAVTSEKQFAVKVRRVQAALKNSGHNPGPVDGVMGTQTRQAIKNFQKDNNLEVTGRIDHKTWDLLKVYLNKKAK